MKETLFQLWGQEVQKLSAFHLVMFSLLYYATVEVKRVQKGKWISGRKIKKFIFINNTFL